MDEKLERFTQHKDCTMKKCKNKDDPIKNKQKCGEGVCGKAIRTRKKKYRKNVFLYSGGAIIR